MNYKSLIVLFAVILSFTACENGEDVQSKGSVNDLSEAVQKYLGVSGDVQKSRKTNQQNNFTVNKGMKSSFLKPSVKSTNDEDTTDVNWNYDESCANVKEGTDDNGFSYIVYDYGTEGCEEYGYLVKGKMSYKWKEEEVDGKNVFESEDVYEDYSYDGFYQDGFYKWNGSYELSSWDFEGQTECNMNYKWGEEIIAEKSLFKDMYTSEEYKVLEGETSWEEKNGSYYYKMKVLSPVVYNYTCEDSYAPVSGEESIESLYEGKVIKFVINYGDGKCDNLVTVTENGVSVEIDLFDLYEDSYEVTDSTKTN